MKVLKKIAGAALALVLALGVTQAAPMTVSAAPAVSSGVKSYDAKVRIYPGDWDNSAIQITLTSSDYYLKSVKSSSKNLKAKVTEKSSAYRSDSDGTVTEDSAAGAVGLYTKKEGKYKVTVTVGKKSDKSFKKTVSVTVYAYSNSPFKSVTANKQDILSTGDSYYFSQKTIKFKATAASGYKIKKIQVGTYKKVPASNDNYDSEMTWKTIKNNGSFKLSSVKNSYKYGYNNSYSGTSYSYKNIYKYIRSSLAAETVVKVTYTDKYTKQAEEAWFYFYYIKF